MMKLLHWLDEHFEELFIGIFSFVMVVVISVQVFMRYVLQDSLPWSEELARYCFIWLVYLGISYGVKKQKHMSVDVLYLALKGKSQAALRIVGNLLFLAFALFGLIYGYQITLKLLTWGQLSPALSLPVGFVYLAGPIGMGLTAIRLIQLIVQQVKILLGKEVPQ
ncbi:TRAP transporter small permease [Robertmurraya korlensis]|uniref:TRAP transporter small permease n=1 Tax=Robertmurraya korlensis TaxID=519977 RepID=UPI0020426554|nr:TRAP transporter small permease [Robertmurraya korlensis]MCM3601624.1 TRAP transporter small permease [Robertmurraya korlensis]